ncbi:MAG: GGDEF domain-containing protein [Myxococcales bacterium]|nr:GGDEF domain-containing protein [Myxococcales bacterium]
MPPSVAGRVIEAAADPETSVAQIADLIGKDAVLSIQVLKAVNSGAYMLSRAVSRVDRAVALLGTRTVRNLVLTLAVRDLVPARDITGFPLDHFWEASLCRAAAARSIGKLLELENVDELFTLGLCQDVGLLLALRANEKLATQLAAAARRPAQHRYDIERDIARETHAEIGAAMFSQWRFSEEIVEAIRHHHDPVNAPRAHRRRARVALAAEAVADLLVCDDEGVAVEVFSEQMTRLGVFDGREGEVTETLEPLIGEVCGLVERYAEVLGLHISEQPPVETIVARAAEGLATLNLAYLQEANELRFKLELREREARVDPLTQLLNRRGFDEALPREVSQAERQGACVSLLMVDIDHFKSINDNYGHPCGDAALQLLGEVLRDVLRTCDVPCRYGGEEFAVILPFTDVEGGQIAAERVRSAIEARPLRWRGDEVSLRASIGGATIRGQRGERDAQRCLVTSADQALYEAKRGGRNRVCWSESAEQAACG